jgi:hypothetical protein
LAAYGIATQIAPGVTQWTPSPAQVAAQINALGLAKDTSVQAVNTTAAGTTTAVSGVNTAVTGVNTTLGTPAQDSIRTAIPNNISTTGAPLLTLSQSLASNTSLGVSASSSNATAKVTITQPSFEMFFYAYYPVANGATPFLFVVVAWYDSNSGLLLDKDTFTTCVNTHAGITGLPCRVKGPSKGNQVQITFYNQDAAQSVNVNYALLGHSRLYTQFYLDWPIDQSENGATVIIPGHTLPAFILPDSRTLAIASNTALAVSGTDGWLIPPHSGQIYFNMWETGVAGASIAVSLQILPSAIYGGNTPWLINDIMVAGNPNKMNYTYQGPNAPTQLNIKNNGSVTASYVATFTGG